MTPPACCEGCDLPNGAQARIDRSQALFHAGYNCAQSVVVPFCDVIGMEEKTALRMASSFGGGVGRLREICGAVSGMALVLGLLYGDIDPEDDSTKGAHYERVQALANRFREMHGTIICRDLLQTQDAAPTPDKRTKQYYETRPCAALVGDAVELLCHWIGREGAGGAGGAV